MNSQVNFLPGRKCRRSSYKPANDNIKMGDHPVIWTNTQKKARNVYIFMGHSPVLFDNEDYKTLFKNAIFWASQKLKAF